MKDAWLQRLFVMLVSGWYEKKSMCLTHQEIYLDQESTSSFGRGRPHTAPDCFTFALAPYSRDPEKAYYLCRILDKNDAS